MGVRKDYRTEDLYFAAFLVARDVEMLDTNRKGTVVEFVFDNVDNMRELRNAYFSGEGEVGARSYANALRSLKSLIHEVQR